MKIYVASSWRNETQNIVVDLLRAQNHEVYDFKNPPNGPGFAWQEVMPEYDGETVTKESYLGALEHSRSTLGFVSDYDAMMWADAIVLVLPCGRSAHLELGWGVGHGKLTCILLDQPSYIQVTPELMYKMVDFIAPDFHSLFGWIKRRNEKLLLS